MSTKTCPSCGLDVPTVARRCKSCFHDFDDNNKRRSAGGPLFLLGAMAFTSILGAVVLGVIATRPLEERILVDQDTQSVVWTRQYRSGVQTDRLMWNQIAKLEYVIQPSGEYSIVAVTMDGTRKTVQSAKSPLKTTATQYAELMEKPLEEVDKTTGFHKSE